MASAERAFCSARRIEIPRWRRLQTSWKISATVGTDQRHDPAAVQREVDLLFAGGYIHPLYFGSSWNRVGDFGAEGLTKLCISRVFCITAGLGFGINSGWHEQRSAGGD